MIKYLETIPIAGTLFVALGTLLPQMPSGLYFVLATGCLSLCIALCRVVSKWEEEFEENKKKAEGVSRGPKKASRTKGASRNNKETAQSKRCRTNRAA